MWSPKVDEKPYVPWSKPKMQLCCIGFSGLMNKGAINTHLLDRRGTFLRQEVCPSSLAVCPSSLLALDLGHYLGGKIGFFLFDAFANLEAGESSHADILADLGHMLMDKFLNGLVRILDIGLLQ